MGRKGTALILLIFSIVLLIGAVSGNLGLILASMLAPEHVYPTHKNVSNNTYLGAGAAAIKYRKL